MAGIFENINIYGQYYEEEEYESQSSLISGDYEEEEEILAFDREALERVMEDAAREEEDSLDERDYVENASEVGSVMSYESRGSTATTASAMSLQPESETMPQVCNSSGRCVIMVSHNEYASRVPTAKA
jgi:hypothetical protein